MKWILTTLVLTIPLIALTQHRVADEIIQLKSTGITIQEFNLLEHQSDDLARYPGFAVLEQGAILKLNFDAVRQMTESDAQLISLDLPTDQRKSVTLDLMESDIFTPDFQLFTSDQPGIPAAYTKGKHYRGMIRGDAHSIVALTVYADEVMAMISNDAGNFILGKIRDSREHLHVLYNDKDLEAQPDFECGTPDDGIGYTKEQLKEQLRPRDAGDCVRVYIEIDDDIVSDKGGATNATNYITGLFNQAITLYANESIDMAISEILAWTTNSPYSGGSSSQMLSSYQQNTGSFNGDLSHLVSYQASGGIAAGFNGICNSNPDLSKCFSSIDASYAVVPTFSWSAMVITHEMGHLIGSRHTHACVWNGNNTAIDGCAGATEGTCSLPGNPSQGGTIMSYCHLTGVGINFTLGFGPQPGNVIRNTVNSTGNCLTPCDGDPPQPEYCASEGTNQQYEWIQSVTLNTINNNSGNSGGYGDFTGQSTSLSTGTQYTITLVPGFSGGSYNEVWRVWIDYNDDMDWNDAGEQVVATSGSGTVNASFTVPSSSPAVTTRMRVSMQYNSAPPVCGSYTYGEVEDYTVDIGGGGGPTCDDGIQNGDEEGVDCGGSQCPACPTCDDGVQNGDEEGVDCGGSCPPCPGGSEIFGSYFESGWDGWSDGGSDCSRYSGSRSWEGNYSINLQDNSGTASAMTSPTFNATSYSSLELVFYFYSYSMENGEDFIVRVFNGSTYVTIAQYVAGTHFTNNSFWVTTIPITPSMVNFASNARIRIQCDASNNSDDIYIDEVTLTGLSSGLVNPEISITRAGEPTGFDDILSLGAEDIDLYLLPNPATDYIRIMSNETIDEIRLISTEGRELKAYIIEGEEPAISLGNIAPGVYILMVRTGDIWTPKKFVRKE